MPDLETALLNYEAMAARHGFRIEVTGPPFDESAARAELAERRIAPNPQYFALLKRWNGAKLRGFNSDSDRLPESFLLGYDLQDFDTSLELYDASQEGFEDFRVMYFQIFADDFGQKLSYSVEDGASLYYHDIFTSEGAGRRFDDLAGALTAYVAAFDAGLTFHSRLTELDWCKEKLAFARIAAEQNPHLESWNEAIEVWSGASREN